MAHQTTHLPDDNPSVPLNLLTAIEQDRSAIQRSIARDLCSALGLTNSYLKRYVKKGLVALNTARALRLGDNVQVTAAPLDRHIDLFKGLNDSQRVTLLLDPMGQQARMCGSVELVDKVN